MQQSRCLEGTWGHRVPASFSIAAVLMAWGGQHVGGYLFRPNASCDMAAIHEQCPDLKITTMAVVPPQRWLTGTFNLFPATESEQWPSSLYAQIKLNLSFIEQINACVYDKMRKANLREALWSSAWLHVWALCGAPGQTSIWRLKKQSIYNSIAIMQQTSSWRDCLSQIPLYSPYMYVFLV